MKKTNLIFYILGSIFTIFGLLLIGICCGIFIGSKQNFDHEISAEATITDISSYRGSDGERSYWAYVTYEADDIIITDKKLNYYSSNMSIGDTITVYYKVGIPEKIRVKQGSSLTIFILCPLGAVFTCIGITFLIVLGKRKKKREQDLCKSK